MPIGDLAPEIAVLLTAVAALLAAMFLPQPRHGLCALLALAGLTVAAAIAAGQLSAHRLTFSGTFALDAGTGWARLMILGATALCVPLAPRWFAVDRRHGEFYAMMLFAALGAMAIAAAADLMQLVIGVLLSSTTGYVLAAYHRDWPISVEAGIKYFLIGALANALMVIGVVLIIGMAGTAEYALLRDRMAGDALTVSGGMLVLVGLLFKLGAVPAYTWVPDVAEGAPVPAAAFLTVVPKIAAAVALARFGALAPADPEVLSLLLALLAAATMVLGTLAAFWQDDVRRLIGWSSVGQAGYALIGVALIGRVPEALPALLGFIAVYAVANIAAFAAIAHLRGRTALADFAGLARTRPAAAAALTLAFLSLVGIPPLAGFFGKFGLFLAAIDGSLVWLALVGIAASVLSLFPYLRVVAPMAFGTGGEVPTTLGRASGSVAAVAALALLGAAPFWGAFWGALPVSLLP